VNASDGSDLPNLGYATISGHVVYPIGRQLPDDEPLGSWRKAVKMAGNGLPADVPGTALIKRRQRASHPEELAGLPGDGSDSD